MVANLTRRGTSHDPKCVRFPYTYFWRQVAFRKQLSTTGTDRQRPPETGGRRSATDRDGQRRNDGPTDRQPDKQTNTQTYKQTGALIEISGDRQRLTETSRERRKSYIRILADREFRD